MSNLLSRFYFFSKLTTSFILLVALLFLGYLFLRAYLVDVNNSNAVNELSKELKILANSVEKNSINLNNIEDLIIKFDNSFDELTFIVSDLEKNQPNEEVLKQIKNLIKENDLLRDDIINLSKKINSSNDQDQKLNKTVNINFPMHNLINLIRLKLADGINVSDEIQLLQNFDYSENKMPYLEKLQILSKRNFAGLNKLNKSFEKISSDYLNDYYLNNNNSFIKYLANIVTIQPNYNGEIKDETVMLLAKTRTKLYEKDLESALESLLLVSNNEIFFKQWVSEINYFIEFEKNLNKLIE